MNNIKLELLAVDGKARVNKVKINKHEFNTPIFFLLLQEVQLT